MVFKLGLINGKTLDDTEVREFIDYVIKATHRGVEAYRKLDWRHRNILFELERAETLLQGAWQAYGNAARIAAGINPEAN